MIPTVNEEVVVRQWSCDVCSKSFKDYDVARHHEALCRLKKYNRCRRRAEEGKSGREIPDEVQLDKILNIDEDETRQEVQAHASRERRISTITRDTFPESPHSSLSPTLRYYTRTEAFKADTQRLSGQCKRVETTATRQPFEKSDGARRQRKSRSKGRSKDKNRRKSKSNGNGKDRYETHQIEDDELAEYLSPPPPPPPSSSPPPSPPRPLRKDWPSSSSSSSRSSSPSPKRDSLFDGYVKPFDKDQTKRWVCDVCGKAKFYSFVDAYIHEKQCRGNAETKTEDQEGDDTREGGNNTVGISRPEGYDSNRRARHDSTGSLTYSLSTGPVSSEFSSDNPSDSTRENRRPLLQEQQEHKRNQYDRPRDDIRLSMKGIEEGLFDRIRQQKIKQRKVKWLCSVCEEECFDDYGKALQHEIQCDAKRRSRCSLSQPPPPAQGQTSGDKPVDKEQQQRQQRHRIRDPFANLHLRQDSAEIISSREPRRTAKPVLEYRMVQPVRPSNKSDRSSIIHSSNRNNANHTTDDEESLFKEFPSLSISKSSADSLTSSSNSRPPRHETSTKHQPQDQAESREDRTIGLRHRLEQLREKREQLRGGNGLKAPQENEEEKEKSGSTDIKSQQLEDYIRLPEKYLEESVEESKISDPSPLIDQDIIPNSQTVYHPKSEATRVMTMTKGAALTTITSTAENLPERKQYSTIPKGMGRRRERYSCDSTVGPLLPPRSRGRSRSSSIRRRYGLEYGQHHHNRERKKDNVRDEVDGVDDKKKPNNRSNKHTNTGRQQGGKIADRILTLPSMFADNFNYNDDDKNEIDDNGILHDEQPPELVLGITPRPRTKRVVADVEDRIMQSRRN